MLKYVGLATTTESLLAILPMADSFRDHRAEPRLHLSLRPEPAGSLLALGHLGERCRGIAVDRSLHVVLLVRRQLRQLQPQIWFPWRRRRLHGLVMDLSRDCPARRRAQCGNGAPDRSRHDGRRVEAPWFKRCDDGRSRRRSANLICQERMLGRSVSGDI